MRPPAKPSGLPAPRHPSDSAPVRIAPVTDATATAAQAQALAANPIAHLNVIRTKVRHMPQYEAWKPLSNHVLRHSTLPPRDREILILRIGWLNQSLYEFTQHVRVAKAAGLDDAEIARIKAGPDAKGWAAFDACLLRAADQLRYDGRIGDAVWAELAADYSVEQLMDVVVTVGQYNMISWFLNTMGTPLEPGVAPHRMAE